MKTLKLIVLMLVTTNFVFAQTTYGTDAGAVGNSNANNAYYGLNAGQNVDTGSSNAYIGALSGKDATTGSNNVGIGYATLLNCKGQNNMAIGFAAGLDNDTGGDNVFMGAHSGKFNVSGASNVYLGTTAGTNNTSGHGNVAIGRGAGYSLTSGSYNVFIGNGAENGLSDTSYKLYIHSSYGNDTTSRHNPLIYGEFNNGKVGIDTTYVPDGYALAVNGKVMMEEAQVMLSDNWPDYVFAEDYDLMPLTTLEAEIETLGHLPGVPSAEEVEENGHALGKMDAILLEKVEELTLHLIDMNKEMTKLRERNEALETRLSEVEDK